MNHRSQLQRTLAVSLAATALAAPAAQAEPIGPLNPSPALSSTAAVVESTPARPAAPVVVRTIDGGFNWSSAAIGAGGASALILLASLGGFARTSRRRPQVAR